MAPATEEVKQQEEEEKMIPDAAEEAMEEPEDEGGVREELEPLTKEEQAALATNLAALPTEKWKKLTKKLAFQDDEVRVLNLMVSIASLAEH